mgnify:CR=1 FL=1
MGGEQTRVLVEDPPFELLDAGGGIDAEGVAQCLAQTRALVQCVGLATTAVEGEHRAPRAAVEIAPHLVDEVFRDTVFDARPAPAATLSAVGNVPVAGLALILGVDRFMSEARALTNLVGNGVATIVVAKWTGELDTKRLEAGLNNETWVEANEPEVVLDAKVAHMAVK